MKPVPIALPVSNSHPLESQMWHFDDLLRFPCIALDGLRFTQIPATLAYAAGLNRFWITLIIYSGKLETATMIATLYTKVKESTNARSTQNQYQRVHLKKKDVPK